MTETVIAHISPHIYPQPGEFVSSTKNKTILQAFGLVLLAWLLLPHQVEKKK